MDTEKFLLNDELANNCSFNEHATCGDSMSSEQETCQQK